MAKTRNVVVQGESPQKSTMVRNPQLRFKNNPFRKRIEKSNDRVSSHKIHME